MLFRSREERDYYYGLQHITAVYEGDRKSIENLIKTIINGNDLASTVYRVSINHEQWKWLKIRCQVVLRNEDIIRVYATFTDMTDEMSAKRTLMQTNDLLTQALSNAKMGAWEYDPYTKNLTQTEHCKKLTHYPKTIVHNVPESMILNNIIDIADIEKYRLFFENFAEKQMKISDVFHIRK